MQEKIKYSIFDRAVLGVFCLLMIFTLFEVANVTKIKVNAATSNNWCWPTSVHSIQSDWPNYSSGKYHAGTDFRVALNSPVYSTCDGEVVDIKSLTYSYGKHIKIKATVNGSIVYIRYCHLNDFAVSIGDKVSAGQLIAYSGSTGNSTGPHMHYEVRNSNDRYGSSSNPNLNPKNYLPGTSYTYETNATNNFPGNEDTSYAVPISLKAAYKCDTYDGNGNKESNRWIDAGDDCYIDKVYENGFCHVEYPSGSTRRWAYTRASAFSIPKKNTNPFANMSKVDRGTNFYAYIIRNENWVSLADVNGNVSVKNDGNNVWYFTKTSDGGYKIKNVATGKYLDVSGAKDEDGCNVQTWEQNDSAAQVWYIYGPWSGEYFFKPKCTSNKVLDVNPSSNNAITFTYDSNNNNQKFALWILKSWTVSYNMNGGSGSIDNQVMIEGRDLVLSSTKPTRNGYTFLGWSTNANDTIAQYQPGGKYAVNSDTILYAIWKRIDESLGTYKYANPNKTTIYARISFNGTDKYVTNLSDNASNDESYKNIQIKTKNDSLQQIWEFEKLSDGGYKISSVYDGRILDIYQTKTENGTNIGACGTYYANGGQIWYLVKQDDKYVIQPKISANVYLGVANTNDGGNVQVSTSANCFNIEVIKPVGTSTMKVTQEGSSTSPTKFSWTAATDVTWYNLYIYDGECWNSNCIYEQKNINGLEWSVQLKPGTYQAHLSPVNLHNWTNSNVVTFTNIKEHKYELISQKAATCITNGEKIYKCSDCGDVKTENIKAIGHQYIEKIVAPTTTEKGYTLHTCSVCGNSYKDNYTDMLKPVNPTSAQIIVDKITANAGKDVIVSISFKNNPGIAGFKFNIKYDTDVLTLKNAESVDIDAMFSENLTDYPFIASWESGVCNVSMDGEVVKLTFTVKENVPEGTYPIILEIDDDNIYNIKEENIHFDIVNGSVTVKKHLPGDINNDGKVNMKDLTRLHQYINGWKVTVVQESVDVNGDGKVNMKDLTRLHQYINGWKVEVY